MKTLHVGCAMWSLKSWQGRFLPHPSTAAERLRAYAGWCNAVEGNTTFYATPARATVASWAEQTDPGFRFILKIPKTVTHERRLTGVDEPMRAFLDAIEPLEQRLGALWVQLPGSFGPGDLPSLARFLRRMRPGQRCAVEVRHQAFFDEPRDLEKVLGESGAEWVPFDTTELFRTPPTGESERDAWARKPRMPLRTRALTDRPVVRYLGRDDPHRTVEGWQRWVTTVATWLNEGRSPTVFIHTPDNTDAPALCRRFHDEVRAQVPDLTPLPTPEPTTLF